MLPRELLSPGTTAGAVPGRGRNSTLCRCFAMRRRGLEPPPGYPGPGPQPGASTNSAIGARATASIEPRPAQPVLRMPAAIPLMARKLARASSSPSPSAAARDRRSSSIWSNDIGSTYGLRRSIEARRSALAGEQALLAGDREQRAARQPELRLDPVPDPRPQLAVLDQLRVAAADRQIRLRARHLRVRQQRREERPLALHLPQQLEPVLAPPPPPARSRARTRPAARSAPASTRTPRGSRGSRRCRASGAASPAASRAAGARSRRPASRRGRTPRAPGRRRPARGTPPPSAAPSRP